jgi:glyoxylase I family protein
MIRDIEHLAIHAKDPAGLVKWYCDTLGFSVTHAIEGNGQYFISLAGGGMIEFLPANDSPTVDHARNDAGIRHIAFTAENYDEVVAELEGKGVTFANDSHDAGEGNKRNFFDDPEGNVLQLIHRPEPLG